MRVRLRRGIFNCSVRLWVPGSTARRDRRIAADDQASDPAHRRCPRGTVLAAYAPARTAGRTQLEATVMRRGKLRKVHVAFAAATVLGQGVGWIARHDPDRRSTDRGQCGDGRGPGATEPRRRQLSFAPASRNRRRRPRCCATAAAARRVALHRRGGILDDQTVPRGVGVGVVARHEEVLRARRLKRDQEPRFLATHGQAMRHVLRERRV